MFTRNTVENIVIVLVAFLMFNTVPKIPVVGTYFQQYPLILLGVAVLLIAFGKRIDQTLAVLPNEKDFRIILASILIFNSLPQFEITSSLLQQNTFIVLGLALIILMFKDQIANILGG